MLKWIKSHKKNSILVLTGIFLISIVVYFIYINVNDRKIVNKLLGTWISRENGSKLELHDYGLCVVRPRIDGKLVESQEDSADCKYEINENTIRVTATVSGITKTLEWAYNDDFTELVTITGTIYTRKEYENDTTSDKDVINDKEMEEYQYGYHTLYEHENGRHVSIRFLKNGICSTDYSNFNESTSPSSVMRYTVTYINNSCTYEKISQRKFKIFDNTIVSRTATSRGKTVNMGDTRVSSSYIVIEFDEKYEALKITNGNFIYTGSPSFLTFAENKNERSSLN